MKVKNYVFSGFAAAIFGFSGISSVHAATEIASTSYVTKRVGDVADLNNNNHNLGDNTVTAILKLDDDLTSAAGDIVSVTGRVSDLESLLSGEGGLVGEDNKIDGDNISDGSIGSGQLADDAVTEGKIADNAVTEDNIQDNAVTEKKIKDGAVTKSKLSSDLQAEINGKEDKSNKIDVNSIETEKANGEKYPSVPAAYSIARVVAKQELSSAGFDSGTGEIDGSKLEDGSVSGDKITNNTITTAKLGDKSVTEPKLADSAVSTRTIIDENVTEAKLATDAVTTTKIKNGAVSVEKLAEGLQKSLTQLQSASCNSENLCVLSFDGSNFSWTDVADSQ